MEEKCDIQIGSAIYPPEVLYLAIFKKQNYAIYLDFDNIYGGLIDFLNIEKDRAPTKLQACILQEVLKCLIKSLAFVSSKRAKYIKAFAEFESLPHKSVFKPNIQAFLNNLGVKTFNPFVAYSIDSGKKKKKGQNASDIALSLEIVSDVLIKNNPIDIIVIASGDIDFYHLVLWLREHTDKEIYIASFKDTLSEIYEQVIDFKSLKLYTILDLKVYEEEFSYLIFLDITVSQCFKSLSDAIIKAIDENPSIIEGEEKVKNINWLKTNIEKFCNWDSIYDRFLLERFDNLLKNLN